MKTPTLCDSRGKQSATLFWVALCLMILIIKFALSGLVTPLGPVPLMTGTEFGIAATGLLAVWTAREHTEKTARPPNG
ncbi:MAG TPA: hypothetical protein DEA26_00715 [Oceanospirillales bacterium]|nr:hypothetical protein [Oceanospirillaceae bacterium]HBS41170.1 hypothetical protein [Oceanospirillales bacterium]|tara:strand:+ start:2020 stop:2253 length:234 start_codon:yes stop_codon:yes gene_type:complete